MHLGDFVAALRRRWYLAIAAVLASVAIGYVVWTLVGPAYTATSTVAVLPPRATRQSDAEDFARRNPLVYLSGLTQTRDIVVYRLLDAATERSVEQVAGQRASYTITGDPGSSAPVMIIQGTGQSPDSALSAIQAVTSRVPSVLSALQDDLDIDPTARIGSVALSTDDTATVNHRGQVRAVLVAAGGAFVLLVLSIGLIDAVLRGWRLRPTDASNASVSLQPGTRESSSPAPSAVPDQQADPDTRASQPGRPQPINGTSSNVRDTSPMLKKRRTNRDRRPK